LSGLSGLKGNFLGPFLGGWRSVMISGYPTYIDTMGFQ
jgi:hypothetical protein